MAREQAISGSGAGMITASAAYMPLKDKSVQAICTSPPYWGLRRYDVPDMAWPGGWLGQLGLEPTPKLYLTHLMQVMAECWRVLRDDGVCFVNLGDTYAGSGGAGGDYNPGGRRAGQPKWKSAAAAGILKPKSLCLIPERFVVACQDQGWIIRNKPIWFKRNHMPGSAKDRFTVAYEQIYFMTKQNKYYFDLDAVREPYAPDSDAVYREQLRKGKRYNVKSPYRENFPNPKVNPLGKNPGDVWNIPTQPYPGAHYSTFPEKLAERMILCSTKPGDGVLDPFAGSGTVGRVAIRLQRRPVLLDLAYHNQQAKRMDQVQLEMVKTAK